MSLTHFDITDNYGNILEDSTLDKNLIDLTCKVKKKLVKLLKLNINDLHIQWYFNLDKSEISYIEFNLAKTSFINFDDLNLRLTLLDIIYGKKWIEENSDWIIKANHIGNIEPYSISMSPKNWSNFLI